MNGDYLGRGDAPVSAATWDLLDTAMVEAAKGILAGRRLLGIGGPYGLGLKAVPMADVKGRKGYLTSDLLPVLLIQVPFCLGKRDLAAWERDGVALDLCAVATAACACATAEDTLVFQGGDPGVPGLMTVKGSASVKLSPWEATGAAAEEIITAVTALDDGGFHGPYTLGLAPARYNLLFRRYPQGEGTELDHLEGIVTGGIFKVPVLKNGGVLLANGRQYAEIVLGQDMTVGFTGPAGENLEFSVSESLVPLVHTPGAICVLK